MTILFLRGKRRDVKPLFEYFPDVFGHFFSIFRYFEVRVYLTKNMVFEQLKPREVRLETVLMYPFSTVNRNTLCRFFLDVVRS